MTKLEIKSLTYLNYGPIDLAIPASKYVCLSGPSGSGKSLMLRAIADLIPHTGSVSLNGLESQNTIAPEWRRQVGLLTAESFWWFDTVGEHLPNPKTEYLEQLGFESDVLGWQISRMSTGEKQRLAIVRLVSQQPKALLLDEPTANLDAENTGRVEKLFKAYSEQNATPGLWVSHNPEQIKRIANRWFKINDGKLSEEKI